MTIYERVTSFVLRLKIHSMCILWTKRYRATTSLNADGITLLIDTSSIGKVDRNFNNVLNHTSSTDGNEIDIPPKIGCNVLPDEFPTHHRKKKSSSTAVVILTKLQMQMQYLPRSIRLPIGVYVINTCNLFIVPIIHYMSDPLYVGNSRLQ